MARMALQSRDLAGRLGAAAVAAQWPLAPEDVRKQRQLLEEADALVRDLYEALSTQRLKFAALDNALEQISAQAAQFPPNEPSRVLVEGFVQAIRTVVDMPQREEQPADEEGSDAPNAG